jgi:hypothetical protein
LRRQETRRARLRKRRVLNLLGLFESIPSQQKNSFFIKQ